MLQRVAVCSSVLQCVAECVAVYCSVYQESFASLTSVCCSVLQCVVVCCSVLQCVAVCCSVLQCVAVCCSMLQYVAVCCSMLQCVAAEKIRLQFLTAVFKILVVSLVKSQTFCYSTNMQNIRAHCIQKCAVVAERKKILTSQFITKCTI